MVYQPRRIVNKVNINFLFLLRVLITVTDCSPHMSCGDLAKVYLTYIKIKFLFFATEVNFKTKYEPQIKQSIEVEWYSNLKASLCKLRFYLESRKHRKNE